MIRTFTSSGGSAVLITHKLDEALRTADRVTVLRQGRLPMPEQSPDRRSSPWRRP